MSQKHEGKLSTRFWWVILFFVGVSVSTISVDGHPKAQIFALHITPWFEIGFNWRELQ